MQQSLPYSVVFENEKIVVSFDRGLLDPDALTRLLDTFRIAAVRRQSQATQEEVDQLAVEVNRKIWQRLKPHVAPGA